MILNRFHNQFILNLKKDARIERLYNYQTTKTDARIGRLYNYQLTKIDARVERLYN
jgi:hypothetical protein